MTPALPLIVFAAPGQALDPACASPITVEAWSALLDDAERAFTDLDEAGFDASMELAAQRLGCLDAAVLPTLAARYHRLVALRLYVRADRQGATLALAAARAVDPFGAFPSALLPPGHEARALAAQASTPGDTRRGPKIRDGALIFDGTVTRARPSDRPTLLQIEVDDAVISSRYLAPSEPLPVPGALRAGPSTASWIAGGAGLALGVGSAVVYGVAAQHARFLDETPADDLSREEVESMSRSTNGLVLASGAGAILSGAGLVVALVRW